ncbi:DivIVA domain-containing protein [Micromonospora sp. NPDC003197]
MGTYRSRNGGPLGPDGIRRVRLSYTGLGRRGYQPAQVDALLARLAAETADRCHQIRLLQAENDRIKNALRTWQTEQANRRFG